MRGGINLYSHMTVTEELSKIKDVTERQALADRMKSLQSKMLIRVGPGDFLLLHSIG